MAHFFKKTRFLNWSVSSFISTVAHTLNSPIYGSLTVRLKYPWKPTKSYLYQSTCQATLNVARASDTAQCIICAFHHAAMSSNPKRTNFTT